ATTPGAPTGASVPAVDIAEESGAAAIVAIAADGLVGGEAIVGERQVANDLVKSTAGAIAARAAPAADAEVAEGNTAASPALGGIVGKGVAADTQLVIRTIYSSPRTAATSSAIALARSSAVTPADGLPTRAAHGRVAGQDVVDKRQTAGV